MQQLSIDIVKMTIGPFSIGQLVPLPPGMTDREGNPVVEDDVLDIEPYKDVTIVLQVLPGNVGRVEYARVDDTSDMLLLGRPISEVKFTELMSHLRPFGIRVETMDDCDRYLTGGRKLGLLGDDIEIIWLRRSTPTERPWKEVTQPDYLDLIVKSARAGQMTDG